MNWLTENWLWMVFGAVFLWMHLKMHGGHGARGGHGGCGGSHGDHGGAARGPESGDGDR